eukprot:SAG11_NODE_178_length_13331_cov_17.694906_8_plen_58_part_00
MSNGELHRGQIKTMHTHIMVAAVGDVELYICNEFYPSTRYIRNLVLVVNLVTYFFYK